MSEATARAYRSAEDVLGFAYGMEARVICKTSGSPSGTGTNPWELHAEAALLLRRVRRSASALEQAALDALYTVPADQALAQRKVMAAHLLAQAVAEKYRPRLPWGYVLDTVREWARLKRLHSEAWWQTHLGVSERTLRRWRLGGANRGIGIIGELEQLRDRALCAVELALEQRALVAMAGAYSSG